MFCVSDRKERIVIDRASKERARYMEELAREKREAESRQKQADAERQALEVSNCTRVILLYIDDDSI